MQRVSKKAFWMPGAQLRKQYVYEQAFPSAPQLCLRMTTHSDTLNTDRAVRKLTLEL